MAKQCQTDMAVRRQHLLENSLLHLLHHMQYPEITVKDICQEAGIPRRTFYHYFENKDDVLNRLIENTMLPGFLAAMFEFDAGYDAIKQSFVRFFRFYHSEHRERLKLLLDHGFESRLISYTTGWALAENIKMPSKNILPPNIVPIARLVGSASFFSLLFHWCKNDFRESPEEMAEYIVWFLTKPLYIP